MKARTRPGQTKNFKSRVGPGPKKNQIVGTIRIRRSGDALIWLSNFWAQALTGWSIADIPSGQKDL